MPKKFKNQTQCLRCPLLLDEDYKKSVKKIQEKQNNFKKRELNINIGGTETSAFI
jgi:hypothetical protein